MDTLANVAEGGRISSLARTKGHKEDTIIDWIRQAGQHAEAIEEVLLGDYQLTRGQIDGLWAYVGNKGEKKLTDRSYLDCQRAIENCHAPAAQQHLTGGLPSITGCV